MVENSTKRIMCKISGHVQGVFFRAYAKRFATKKNILGFAKNMPDGSVEVVAEGTEKDLKLFVKHIKQGPKSAKVENIDVFWEEPQKFFNSFESR